MLKLHHRPRMAVSERRRVPASKQLVEAALVPLKEIRMGNEIGLARTLHVHVDHMPAILARDNEEAMVAAALLDKANAPLKQLFPSAAEGFVPCPPRLHPRPQW
jgi:hypothetical protein